MSLNNCLNNLDNKLKPCNFPVPLFMSDLYVFSSILILIFLVLTCLESCLLRYLCSCFHKTFKLCRHGGIVQFNIIFFFFASPADTETYLISGGLKMFGSNVPIPTLLQCYKKAAIIQ